MMLLANALCSTDDIDIFWLEDEEYSNSLTAVVFLGRYDADKLHETILEHYNLSLGTGLGGLKGKVFHIGHLDDFSDLMLARTLCGVQMRLTLAGIPHGDGLPAALDFLTNRQSAAVVAS